MNKIDWRIVCTGLLAITALEIVALLKGVNGVLLSMALIIISVVIGAGIPLDKFVKH